MWEKTPTLKSGRLYKPIPHDGYAWFEKGSRINKASFFVLLIEREIIPQNRWKRVRF